MAGIRGRLTDPLLTDVYEIPGRCDGRGFDEGKRISWRDRVVALWVLPTYRCTE